MKKRLIWIDNAKGIGILLVVLGHTYGIPVQLHHIIYSFHMPLFFILSGYTFHPGRAAEQIHAEGPGNDLRRLAHGYLVPYLILAALNFCGNAVYELYCGKFSFAQQLRYLGGTLYCYANMSWMPMCSPIWFLVSIFLVKAAYTALFLRLGPGKRHIAAAFCGLLAYGSSLLEMPRLPWNLFPSLFGIFFFHIGTVLGEKKYLSRLREDRKWLAVGIPAALACLPMAAGNLVGMNENTYGNPGVFLLTSVLYSVVLMAICPGRKSLLTWIGENSMIFMGFNYLMRAYMVEVYYFIPIVRNHPIHWTVYFLMTLLSLMVIAYVSQRWVLPRFKKKVTAYEKN